MNSDELRSQILSLVSNYYDATFATKQPFVPGRSAVPVNGRVFDADDIQSLVSASLDFWLTHGPFASLFEHGLASFIGTDYAVLCNSGSSANLLAACAALSPRSRFEAGDEVITIAAGFPTTVNPVVQLGGVPVFVDVDLPSYNVRIDQLDDALSNRTKGVILAHTLGNPFDVATVRDFCDSHDLWLIEDCCDAVGTTYDGCMVGTFGELATTSHYPAHHITTGEGGCVLTSRDDLKTAAESFRDWGRDCHCATGQDNACGNRFGCQHGTLPHGYDHKFVSKHIGYNLKATDLQAAIGISQLKKLPQFIAARRANYNTLRSALGDMDDVFMFTDAAPKSKPSWFGFPLGVRTTAPFTRNALVRHLNSRKIATRLLFAGNLTRHPAYADVPYRTVGDLPNSDFVAHNVFWIGVYPGLTDQMLSYVATVIREFVRGR